MNGLVVASKVNFKCEMKEGAEIVIMRHALQSYHSLISTLPSSLSFRVRSSSLSASTSFWYLIVHSSSARGSSAYQSAWSSSLEVCDIDKRDLSFSLVFTSDIINIRVFLVKTHFRIRQTRRHCS